VGSPQIRNRGTLIGNVMTASPAADTLPVLFIMDAEVILQSQDRGIRSVPITRFFRGPKRTVVEPDELVTEIKVRSLKSNERGCFLKLADRQAMGISIVNVAVRVQYTHENTISDVRIALGSVGPTIMRAYEAERRLMGEKLSEGVICEAVSKVHLDISPISDIRGTAEYRTWMAEVLVRRALELIQIDGVKNTWPDEVVTLSIRDHGCNAKSAIHEGNSVLEININGKDYSVAGGFKKSLLHLIRDDVGLTGTKKGCAEGRCGACTVMLDGQAVLSCLIPTANAHKREVVTIEGLANIEDSLPLRNAFVAEGAVQCGYCTPGFMMSAFALQQSEITPTHKAVTEALAGNLCRCTGYTRILSAVEKGILKQSVSVQL
jgi:xanthine dehydrogenase iron-sulfur cluster and FAD-binding subunit A